MALASRMRIIAAAMISCVLMSGCTSMPQQDTQLIDDDYVLALSAANEFLAAWRKRDQDRALAILSPHLRKSKDEERWRAEISGISNPHNESYEVTNGRRLSDVRYVFDVWLYDHYTGESARRAEKGESVERWMKGKPFRIVVIKAGFEEWKVDEIPWK